MGLPLTSLLRGYINRQLIYSTDENVTKKERIIYDMVESGLNREVKKTVDSASISYCMDELATREDIINAYRFMLGREPESEEILTCNISLTRRELHKRLIQSFEHERIFVWSKIDKTLSYSVPNVLSTTPLTINRILLIGSCNTQQWADHINSKVKCDFLLFNGSSDIGEPPISLEKYDFQIIQIPIRSVISDKLYFTNLTSIEECEKAFEESTQRLNLRGYAVDSHSYSYSVLILLAFMTRFEEYFKRCSHFSQQMLH